jgi:hypothetical protein
MVVSEQYPNLKANQAFQDLRVQLEGTENRITVARNRYIKTVQDYNVLARSFPSNLTAMVFSYASSPASRCRTRRRSARRRRSSFDKPPASASEHSDADAPNRRASAGAAWLLGWLPAAWVHGPGVQPVPTLTAG